MRAVIMSLCVLCAVVTSAQGQPAAAMAKLQDEEPSLAQVRAAALRHARLDGFPERGWGRRARLSGLLPDVTVRVDHGSAQGEGLSRSSSGTERLDIDSDRDFGLEVKAVWHLDRLVFHEAEIRTMQAVRRLQDERSQLLLHVTNLYFQRRKLQLTFLHQPATEVREMALNQLAVAELTAQLDALTGGYFSHALRGTARHSRARQR